MASQRNRDRLSTAADWSKIGLLAAVLLGAVVRNEVRHARTQEQLRQLRENQEQIASAVGVQHVVRGKPPAAVASNDQEPVTED